MRRIQTQIIVTMRGAWNFSGEREQLVMEKGHLRRILKTGWLAIVWRAVGIKRAFFWFSFRMEQHKQMPKGFIP